jgi:hypothetical protein
MPKILLFDVETSPNIGYTWGKWEQNVIRYVKEWELLSFAYKWLDSDTVHCVSRKNKTERQLVIELRDLWADSDILVAHNGDEFDLKKARTKFLQHGLKPPPLNRSVDTKKVAKAQFAFNSNSLNDLGETLGLGRKLETGGFDLWLGCMRGEAASWNKMIEYNKQDVLLLEKVYLKMRAWHTSHPNLSADSIARACPVCQSDNVRKDGTRINRTIRQQRWHCNECGHYHTSTFIR